MLDDRKSVLAKALERDAGDHLALAVQLGNAAPFIGGELHAGDVREQHGYALVRFDYDLLEIGQVLDVAASAHRVLGLRHLDGTSADIHVAFADDISDVRERDAERLQAPRIDDDAVLLDEA